MAGVARAADEGGGHVDAFSFVLIELASVILIAGIGRWGAGRVGQPSVLGASERMLMAAALWIFSSLGMREGSVFSARVRVVILSTVVSPPLLMWAVAREPA